MGYSTPNSMSAMTLRSRSCDTKEPITHSTLLDFIDFVTLYKSFCVRTRKDLRDLFDHFAISAQRASQFDDQLGLKVGSISAGKNKVNN